MEKEKTKKLVWAIFYRWVGQDGIKYQPIFSADDGKYYLGGTRRIGYLLFATKKEAQAEVTKVKKDPWFKNDKNIYQGHIVIKEFKILPV